MKNTLLFIISKTYLLIGCFFMKKIIVLIIMLMIVLVHTDIDASTAKKIDLKTKEDEVNIVFLKLRNSTSLLIDEIDHSKLFFLKYENNKGVGKALDIFSAEPEIFWMKNSSGYIDNLYIQKSKYILIKINDYNLCIVEDEKEAKDCDFIYLLSLNEVFTVDKKTTAVFYDENIPDDYLSEINESWIESHIVSLESFTILKLNKEEYTILVVPLANK